MLAALANFALGTLAPLSMLSTLAGDGSLSTNATLTSTNLTEARSVQLAETPNYPIQLVDQVIEGSHFDEFRDRLWVAVQQRDVAHIYALLPEDGIFIGQEGPIPPHMLALEDPDSPFWRSLEKMLAPQSCGLMDYPSTSPDGAVWGCPNIASALSGEATTAAAMVLSGRDAQVVVVGQRVNVRSHPGLGNAVVGNLSNEMVEFDYDTWQELMRTSPETTHDPIDGWTPVILPNQVKGYVYNRYVYHPQGPQALFELLEGQWRLVRIVFAEAERAE